MNKTIPIRAPTRLELIDCEPMRDEDRVAPGFYVGATGINMERRVWRGCVVARSRDGVDFNERVATLPLAASIGHVTVEGFAACTVHMLNDRPLLSTTHEGLAKGANLCVIGNRVAQFVTANLIDKRTYMVTEIYDRASGAPFNINRGERFVLADTTLARVTIDESLLGQPMTYMALTTGMRYADGIRIRFTCEADWWTRNIVL